MRSFIFRAMYDEEEGAKICQKNMGYTLQVQLQFGGIVLQKGLLYIARRRVERTFFNVTS